MTPQEIFDRVVIRDGQEVEWFRLSIFFDSNRYVY